IDASIPVVITPSVLATAMLGNVNADQSALARIEKQVSTGYAVNVASDNPAQAANILQLQSGVTRANQYATNAQDGMSWLSLANSTVSSVLNVLQRVESAVQSITGDELSGNTSAVAGLTNVVTGALKELVNLSNTQYAGQAIFSGTGKPTQAYSTTGSYLGAGTPPTRMVAPDTKVAVSVAGPTIFGTGTTGLLSQVSGNLGVLARVLTDLKTGTTASLGQAATTGLADLQTAMGVVEAQAGKLGADQQSMQGFSTQATASATALGQELGDAQDVNMAQALTNLQLQQTSYQAALYVTSQLKTDSLINYL
ncbi:MAG: flagellin, partial [Acidimicrobiales bacterium]